MLRQVLARASVFAIALACVVPLPVPSVPTDVRSISVAEAFATAPTTAPPGAPERVRDVARGDIVLGVQSTPVAIVEPAPTATPEPTPEPTIAPTPAPTPKPVLATLPPLPDPPTSGIVIASWYGPGFYGNRTACGQVYTPEIVGVAHRTLRCGTMVVLEYRGRTMTVPVIDRGPYIAGRTLDLSNATRLAIGCPDLCTLSMRIAQ
jgi:rare lipoprotein A (RlpA)-like double-psi beta-barrel protein